MPPTQEKYTRLNKYDFYFAPLHINCVTKCIKSTMEFNKTPADIISTQITLFTLCIQFYQLGLSHLKRLSCDIKRNMLGFILLSSHITAHKRSIHCLERLKCFEAVWLSNAVHSRDRICKWDQISVVARKVPSVETFGCCTAGSFSCYNSGRGACTVRKQGLCL